MQKITGTKDILPNEILKYRYVENTSRKIFEVYGYNEIRTPIFESTEVFSRSIGEATDIVEKEMYSFKDKANRSLTLRPEGTASIVRAYIENGFFKSSPFMKLFYIGPMFRAEKPQKGRYREFNQIGVEAIGSSNPAVDAEIIEMLMSLFNEFGLMDFNIMINSVGCSECRKKYREDLKSFIKNKISSFCDNCKIRADKNTIRVLDCKNESCVDNLKTAPSILDYLCSDCGSHFENVQKFLSSYSIKYDINKNLVRGLDYYTKTTFEITSDNNGSQNAIAAGGRYDSLVKDFEGPDTPAIGFAIGIERLLDAIEEKKAYLPDLRRLDVFFATLGEDAFNAALLLIKELRKNKVSSDIDYSNEKSLKSQMRKSNQLNARFTIIIGDDELKKGVCTIKDMDKSIQEEVKIETDTLLRRINQK